MLDPFDSKTWTKDERDYFRAVDKALKGSIDRLISNGKPQHAAYLIEKFLAHAQQVVRIFSGRLARAVNGVEVYENDQVLAAAEKLLKKGASLHIVLEQDIDLRTGETWTDHPVAQLACRLRKEGMIDGVLDIRQASEGSLTYLKDRDFPYHWMIMDESAYRLETDIGKAKAHANFGDGEMAGKLARIFDHLLFNRATPLSAGSTAQ